MSSWIFEFQEWLVANQKQPRTQQSYLRAGAILSEWYELQYLKPLDLADLSGFDLAACRRYLQAQDYEASTINKIAIGWRMLARFVLESKVSARDLRPYIHTIPEPKLAPRWLDRNEKFRLIHEVEARGTVADLAVVYTFFNTGVRVGEFVRLKWSHIDLRPRQASLHVAFGKGSKSRDIPLNPDARRALEAWHKESHAGELTPTWVFPSTTVGKHISERAIEKKIAKYAYHAHIEATPHSLRHTFLHDLVSSGKVSLDVAAMLAGHITNSGAPNVRSTVRYTIPSEADLRQAVQHLSISDS